MVKACKESSESKLNNSVSLRGAMVARCAIVHPKVTSINKPMLIHLAVTCKRIMRACRHTG